MEKRDFKKTLACYQAKHHVIQLLDIPPMRYLMVDGHGDPNTAPEFAAAIQALYPIAYHLKFASKNDLQRDYTVMPLEGLWWSSDMRTFTSARDKAQWDWTLMIMQPDWITPAMFAAAVASVAAKGAAPGTPDVRLETLDEGRCVQTLHIGPFDDEAEILAQMHDDYIPSHGLKMVGKHHEIYFSDLRKTAPARLRTLLRQPVEAA